MKKILFAIAAVATLFATSCKKESVNPAVDVPEGAFVCTIDNGAVQNIIASGIKDDMGTMTTIPDGRNIFWKVNDVIHINGIAYTATTVTNGQATFTTTGTAPTPTYYAFYGDNLESFNADGATLKSSFAYDNDNNAANLPMYATGSENTLTFSNICAVLEIKIPAACDKIQLSASTNMSGAFTVNNNKAVLANATGTGAGITVTGTFAANDLVYVAIPEYNYANVNFKLLSGSNTVIDKSIATLNVVANKIYPVTFRKVQKDCFYFEATEATTTTVTLKYANSAPPISMEYLKLVNGGSLDDANWVTCDSTSNTAVTLNNGDKLYFRSTSTGNQSLGVKNYQNKFAITGGKAKIGGKLMYLINSTASDTNALPDYAFKYLFYNQTNLTDISNLVFPSKTSQGCFAFMFGSCLNLNSTSPITLPATDDANQCYHRMFAGCSALDAPVIINLSSIDASSSLDCMLFACRKLSEVWLPNAGTFSTGAMLEWIKDSGTDESVSYRTIYVKDAAAQTWFNNNSTYKYSWNVDVISSQP